MPKAMIQLVALINILILTFNPFIMKTKITFQNFATVVIAFLLLSSFSAKAQTYVYNETISSGMFFESPNGAQVANPVSDAVNSSANCAYSGTTNPFPWLEIQYFPNFTPTAGTKLFFSVYNPNAAAGAQIQFNNGAFFGGNVTYVAGSATGWVEYSITLDDEIGNALTKITLYPDSGNPVGVYIDNIYFGTTSVLPPPNVTTYVYNETTSSGMFFESPNGAQVANPVPDAVNSSANCAYSGTNNPFPWLEIQYFPNFTPTAGTKLYFSVYNPNAAAGAQIQFNNGAYFGGNVSYVAGSATGWVEYSITLDDEIGNAITKITLYPDSGNPVGVYIDNIYFGTSSVLPPPIVTSFVYNETTSSGMFFESPNGSQVANPVSNSVNSSANCAYSGTINPFPWLEIQYFPNFTPTAGTKLYFSAYNPNAAAGAQIQFNNGAFFGGNVTYVPGSATGWVEYSITLDDEIGTALTKITLYPDSGNPVGVYIDNIYFSTTSNLNINSVAKIANQVYISKEGSIQFTREQTNTLLSVYDLTGRLVLEEKINGMKGEKVLNQIGIYILRVKSDTGVSTQKIAY
jgi:hypothetical protein